MFIIVYTYSKYYILLYIYIQHINFHTTFKNPKTLIPRPTGPMPPLPRSLHLRLDLTSNHVATNVPVMGIQGRHQKNPRFPPQNKHPHLFLSGLLFRDSLVVNENNPKGEIPSKIWMKHMKLSRLSFEGWSP